MSLQCQVQRLCILVMRFFTYVYMLIYVYIYEQPFSKTWAPNLALTLQHRFLHWCLARFRKELYIYLSYLAAINKSLDRCSLFGFFTLATSEFISGWVPICDKVYCSWFRSGATFCSYVPLGDQAAGTMDQHPTQSHYPDTELYQSLLFPSNAKCQAQWW